jgi:DNA-binding response OmpR family regulator
LAVIGREAVDAVLSDWHMPHKDGLALLQALRASPATRGLPFVMMLADTEPQGLRLAMDAGAQGALVKPFHGAALAERLRSALSASRRRSGASLNNSTEPAPSATAKPLVLIVDDQPDTLHLMIEMLKADCRLKLATSGERALALCQLDAPPDLVLLDVVLPGMDGFEVVRRLRQHPASCNIPVLMVSAVEEHEFQTRALELGAVDFISKPVDAALLRLRVRNVAQHAAHVRQLQAEADRLQQQAALQDELAQVVDTDLRSPLAHALATLEPLLNSESLSTEHREAMQSIESSLLETIDALHMSSELLRIEQGRFGLRARAVPLRKVLERVQRLQAEAHAHKQLVWDLQLPGPLRGPGCLIALGDTLLCHSLFQQLLRQACELAPPESTIRVALTSRDDGPDGYCISFDVDALVPTSFRARFFAKFVSLNGDGTAQDAAGAVGCYAARQLAQAQRGDVRLLVNDSTGRSSFQVLLLRAQALVDGA